MSRIKRWLDHRRVVWTEPALPKYIKINPNSPPGAAEGLQPGDMLLPGGMKINMMKIPAG